MFEISENRARPRHPANASGGLSLIELLIVLAVLGIVTGAVLTHLQSSVNSELNAAAQVVVSDLTYIRNLSVTNNSNYRVTFTPGTSKYYFEHAGTNTTLDVLPAALYGVISESPTRQSMDVGAVSLATTTLEVVAVLIQTSVPTETSNLEFGPLGETTRSEETTIWLAAGNGNGRRYIPVTVNPVTGNSRIGEQTTSMPLGAVTFPSGGETQSP